MEDDGLERVKNQGRHDIKNKWKEIEKYWLEVARTKVDTKYNTHQWIDSKEYLSYQKLQKPFEIYEAPARSAHKMEIASSIIDLPAPVSPVNALNPDLKSRFSSSISMKFLIYRCFSITFSYKYCCTSAKKVFISI